MGKSTAMWGKTNGKVGGLVYSTSGGVQIVREYNPNVANPSTTAQVNQRAKMKLMSQISATLSPIIAMTKEGLVSRRNKFVSTNFNYAYASGGVAQVSYENLQVTEGQLGLPMITGAAADGRLSFWLADQPSPNIARVAWSIFKKTEEAKLEFVESNVVEKGNMPTAPFYYLSSVRLGSGTTPTDSYVIYAYGMVDTSERATTRYGNLSVENATDIARLVANRTIDFTDYQFTQTRGATWVRGQAAPTYTGATLEPNQVRIYITPTEGGLATGGGIYTIGDSVTLSATPNSGYEFVNWQVNGGGVYSTSNPLTLTASEQLDLVAQFRFVGQDTL